MRKRRIGVVALWSLLCLWPMFVEARVDCRSSGLESPEVDGFLEDLRRLDLELVSPGLPPGTHDATAAFSVARYQLETLLAREPETQRQELCDALERLPSLRAAPAELRRLLAVAAAEEPREGDPESGIDPLCLSTPAYLAAFGSFQILKTTATVAQTVCDASECPVYAGVIVCAPVPPACALACPLAGIAEALALVAEAFLTGDDYCGAAASKAFLESFSAETDTTLGAIVERMEGFGPLLDATLSSRAAALSLESLDGDTENAFSSLSIGLSETFTTLATSETQREALEELENRLRIEELLAEPGGGPVGSLRRTAEEGGELEVVREVVAVAIQRTLDAGEDVGEALFYFRRGDLLLNGGETLPAYNNYRDAYLEAAAETIDPELLGAGSGASKGMRGAS